MRKIITIIFLAISFIATSQEVDVFEITPNGINGYLVQNFENKSNKDIYVKIKKWIEYNIKNPDFSVKNDIENEYISFKISNVGNVMWNKNDAKKGSWTLSLKIEIRIKNSKTRIDITEIGIIGRNGASPIEISSRGISNSVFKKDKIRKGYEDIRLTTNESLNNFSLEIFNSIRGNADYKKTDW